MKKYFLFLILLSAQAVAQPKWTKIDKLARNVPASVKQHLDSLVRFIRKNTFSEEEKVRFIFVWIADNIRYDMTKANTSDPELESQTASTVFSTRKAICTGYTHLFYELCQKTSITVWNIDGYVLQQERAGHAWNAVKIGENWQLIDVTWASGYMEYGRFQKKFNGTFFFADPKTFIENHFPADPMWQLSPNPVTLKDFLSRKTYNLPEKPASFYFQDTLKHFFELDSTIRLSESYSRAALFSPDDALIVKNKSVHLYTAQVYRISDLQDEATQNLRLYFEFKQKAFSNLKHLNDNELNVRQYLLKSHVTFEEALKISQQLMKMKLAIPNLFLFMENQNGMRQNLAYIQQELIFVEKFYKTQFPSRRKVLDEFPNVLSF